MAKVAINSYKAVMISLALMVKYRFEIASSLKTIGRGLVEPQRKDDTRSEVPYVDV